MHVLAVSKGLQQRLITRQRGHHTQLNLQACVCVGPKHTTTIYEPRPESNVYRCMHLGHKQITTVYPQPPYTPLTWE